MSFIHKLRWLIWLRRKEDEIQEELEFHLEEEAQERQTNGLAADEAKWAAHRQLGNVTLLQENVRAVWIWTSWERLLQDLRYAVRMMIANKAFSALAILSLALGIGVNTALYSILDSILLRSLPVADPDSLVILQWHSPPRWQGGERRPSVRHSMSGTYYNDPKLGDVGGIFPYPAYELFRNNDALFSSVFAYHPTRDLNVVVNAHAEIIKGEYVSGDYFGGLGVRPIAGRMLVADDDDAGAQPIAVVSSKFSEQYFGGATNAAGRTILINNVACTVAGVTPPEFFGVDPAAAPDVYLPMHANAVIEAADPFGGRPQQFLDQNYYWIQVMARLRSGVTREQVQAALAPQFHQWVESTATNENERQTLPALMVQEGAGGVETLRREYSQPLFILMALSGLILVIACANIANLLLARGAARRSEMALRLSLGAGRLRLVRQLLTESVLLASLGGALGILVALWGTQALTAMLPNVQRPITPHSQLNLHVLGLAVALSLLTGVLFGLAPAISSTRVNISPALKNAPTGNAGSRMRPGLSRVLMVSQIAFSLLLLVVAGLFVRTLVNLQSVELGFNRENLLLFELDASKAGHKDPEISVFYSELLQRVRAIPGVVEASLSHQSLIDAGSGLDIHLPGLPPDDATRYLAVGPGFFRTMQIPILSGREIEWQDQPNSTKVAVISELFARINFPNQSPLGRHIILENENIRRDMEIVGLIRNAHYGSLWRESPPVVYIPYNQGYPPPRAMTYELRATGDPLAYVSAVREIVHQSDVRVPVTGLRTQVADIDQTLSQEIIFAKLCTGFAALALVIACVGLYGTVSYNVTRRTAEIGIRMALGAQPGEVIWMILREVVVLAAVSLAIAVPIALSTSHLIRSFLFGMTPNDPLALAMAIAILLSAALLAAYLPARKGSRIDPMVALRHD